MRWSASTGMQGLGFVGNNGFTSSVVGVSADGSVMAGVSQELNSPYQAMRWSEEDGMVSLGTLSGFTHSFGFAVSGDGRTVAGAAYAFGSGDRTEAFRWTAAEGMRPLLDNPPPDGPSGERFVSWANAASHDGSVVVGQMGYQTQNGGLIGAFVWTQATGAQSLESILTGAGFDLDGWLLQSAVAISADGQVIAGNARRAVGNGFLERGFVVDFRVVPEPSAFASALVAVGAIALRRRRGSQVYAITDT
jgi:probable HAF family extracellular repeat protein